MKNGLDCHPEKNPDSSKSAELFHELLNALEILFTVSRTEYGKSIAVEVDWDAAHQQEQVQHIFRLRL